MSRLSSVRVPVLSKHTSLILPHMFTLVEDTNNKRKMTVAKYKSNNICKSKRCIYNSNGNKLPTDKNLTPSMASPLWTDAKYLVLFESIESVHCSHGEGSWQGGGHRCRDYINCSEHCFTDLVVMHLADDDGVHKPCSTYMYARGMRGWGNGSSYVLGTYIKV